MKSDWLPPNSSPPVKPLALPSWFEVISEGVRSLAFDLRPQHVAEVGFRREPALSAVDELVALRFAIVGGDVWDTRSPIPEPSFDNWHAERTPGEPWDAYVIRAAQHSRERIRFFDPAFPDGTALFVLVACSEPRYAELTVDRRDQ